MVGNHHMPEWSLFTVAATWLPSKTRNEHIKTAFPVE
jgi:hypothetical protein